MRTHISVAGGNACAESVSIEKHTTCYLYNPQTLELSPTHAEYEA